MFSHPSTFIKLHHLVLILKLLLVLESETEIFLEVWRSGNQWITQLEYRRDFTGSCSQTSDAEKMALVPLASPSGSSQGQRAQELKPTIRLGTEPRTHLHLSGQSWMSSGHRSDLGALPLAQHWNAHTNLPQRILGEEQLIRTAVKYESLRMVYLITLKW